jgi:RNA polymerase sigma-70 factor, ECF subfamily
MAVPELSQAVDRGFTGVVPPFGDVYEAHASFVFRTLRALGVAADSVDDAAQDVFVVVHRRLPEFDGSSAIKPWLYAIARRVAHDHRRTLKRKGNHEPLSDTVREEGPGPMERAARSEGLEMLEAILNQLDDDRREVLVLSEIEQLSSPEIAEMLNTNLNTVYSRLRRAREAFDKALQRRLGTENP